MLSTLNRRISPTEMEVVQPDSVVSWLLVADEMATGAEAVMLSASVGG
jgi:hypothetical protein